MIYTLTEQNAFKPYPLTWVQHYNFKTFQVQQPTYFSSSSFYFSISLLSLYLNSEANDLMASACVNNNVGLLSEKNFFNGPNSSSFDWFNPRDSKIEVVDKPSSPTKLSENLLDLDFSGKDNAGGGGDFEFRLENPVNMLPADELFFDGKLMPLHVSTNRLSNAMSSSTSSSSSSRSSSSSEEIRSASVEEILKSKVSSISSGMDPYLFSPKAPRCSSGWRELLGLKKLQQNSSSSSSKTPSSKSINPASLKHFIQRNPKSDHSLALPLLKETDSPVSISSLIDCDVIRDLPRVSLDSHHKSYSNPPVSIKRNHHHPPKVRLVRKLPDSNTNTSSNNTTTNNNMSTMSSGGNGTSSSNALGVSMDSPRMNSSGKVVFQSLERSSSSPSTFNGGPRVKYKGMERRSYSANVKVSPVLNVPVCSLRGSSKFGLGQLFPSPHKKTGGNGTSSSSIDFSSEKVRTSSHVNKQKPSS
ncbi:hypothetical protein AQUCO_02600325v1 [Aquilegia coerulea]|uniref:Uncharacterized protein n=1 Tax=Aquilegia coerulea TaxID=218851 RepID=A0A2G5D8D3_AQUCA|nr:hypothetical protein AQUCO_02600325v1 [Aquilegia coerulea]